VRHLVGISEAGVYRLVGRGELPVVKVGGRTLFRAVCGAPLRRGEPKDGGTVSDIGVCWDADRLQLSRLGIRAEASYLSTIAGLHAAAGS
jgi:hypothetical protein